MYNMVSDLTKLSFSRCWWQWGNTGGKLSQCYNNKAALCCYPLAGLLLGQQQRTSCPVKLFSFREGCHLFHQLSVLGLLLLHWLFVWLLHLVHLHSHIRLLILKVCFELCELSVLFQDRLIPLLQKSLQRHHLLFQLTDENEVVCSSRIHWLGDGTTVSVGWLHLQFWFLLWSLLLDWRRFMALLPQSLLLFRTQAPTQFVVRTAVSVVMVVMMVRSGVVVFLVQGWGVGRAKALPLLLGLLQDAAVGESTQPAQQLSIHLSSPFLLAIKSTLLFALLTGLWGSIFFLWVGTTLALCPNESCDDVTVLTRFGCSKLFDVLGTFLADCICFTFLLKLRPAVCALHYWMCNATLLTQLLALRQLLEGIPLVTLCTGIQSRRCHPSQTTVTDLAVVSGVLL